MNEWSGAANPRRRWRSPVQRLFTCGPPYLSPICSRRLLDAMPGVLTIMLLVRERAFAASDAWGGQ
jgi:hypothetical protein